jgi:Xaa-Pro aminopeptidase
MSDRLASLRALAAGSRLDGVLVTDSTDVHYLSGFRGDDALLVVTAGAALIVSDSRYWTQITEEAPGFDLVMSEGSGALLDDAVSAFVRALGAGGGDAALGFQGGSLSYADHRALRRRFHGRLRDVGDHVSALRCVKDETEIATMRAAAAVADAALEAVIDQGLRGRAEADVAWAIGQAVHDAGGDGLAFPAIVAGGPQGALPHALAGERVIVEGDLVVVDMGARLEGYNSDITRTFAVGRVGDEERTVYDVVARAQHAGLAAALGGVDCVAVDAAARRVIDDAGYGERFGHGTGHGVGLDVHEQPRLGRRSGGRLRAGMVVTIEPGIYLPGRFGVRIEDTVAVTAGGCECLTLYPKELQIVE